MLDDEEPDAVAFDATRSAVSLSLGGSCLPNLLDVYLLFS